MYDELRKFCEQPFPQANYSNVPNVGVKTCRDEMEVTRLYVLLLVVWTSSRG